MSDDETQFSEFRQFPRLSVPPMYTLLRARPLGEDRYCWSGHIYDVSEVGMRFELDEALEPGTPIEVRAMLPGARHIVFNASGRVVRLHDDVDERGPMRMGMIFDSFSGEEDQSKLVDYLGSVRARAA